KVIEKRYNTIKQVFNFINLDNYILGRNLVLTLGNTKLFAQPLDPNITYMVYSLNKKYVINNSNIDSIYKTSIGTIIEKNGIKLCISYKLYDLPTILIQEQGIMTDGKILVTPLVFQSLSNYDPTIVTYTYKTDIGIVTTTDIITLNCIQIQKNIPITLDNIKGCYICKKFFDLTFIFGRYSAMCIQCGMFNHMKKNNMTDLKHIRAFITGIRHKIGYHTVLKLLRCGATVYGTTRFPHSAWYNYSREPDFEEWKDKLIIMKCNFLKSAEVKSVISFIQSKKVNVLINNACLTIRPSYNYISNLVSLEDTLIRSIDYSMPKLIDIDVPECNTSNSNNVNYTSVISIYNPSNITNITNITNTTNTTNITNTTMLVESNITNLIVPATKFDNHLVSSFKFNKFGDIYDPITKSESSWTKKIEDIAMDEIVEVNIINQIVPTLLISQIKPSMDTSFGGAFIINVTAVEGKFNSKKTKGHHPHTNMCKAGINMMIKTMASEMSTKGRESVNKNGDSLYHYYAIDPGFVSGVDPNDVMYPLSPRDGASRILDPIISFYQGKRYPLQYHMYKNYKQSKW
ncbi:MAG: dehydrogenase/oxidoreductase, partial [Homavirus sp.]